MRIILASASPRRRELLTQLGWEFEVMISDVEEVITRTLPQEVVEELSYIKAKDVFDKTEGDVLVIGSDTVVAYENRILGKPRDVEDAKETLARLSGNSHHVFTGVTLFKREGETVTQKTFHEATRVEFYPMTGEEIDWYVASGECSDKAGSYAIQGLGGRFVKSIEGDYNNVVGLPIARLYHEVQYEEISNF